MKKYLAVLIVILIIIGIVPIKVSSTSKRIVIINMDDIQEDWLENIAVKLMELHVSKKIPVVVGVLPYLLDMPGGTLKSHLKNFYNEPMIEIAQHGYDHSEYLGEMSYEEQKNTIERGLKILLSLGIQPNTFVPPFGSADSTTLKALSELGFHTIVNPIEDLQSEKLIVIAPLGVPLCKGGDEGYSCVFKSAKEVMEEIDQRIEVENGNVISVYYHMQDVSTKNNTMNYTKYNQLSILLDKLKNSNKYRFITAENYHRSLTKKPIQYLNIYLFGAIGLLVISFVYLLKKHSQIKSTYR